MTDTTVTPAANAQAAAATHAPVEPAIERLIHLRAAPDLVWKALTVEAELSAWFGTSAHFEVRVGAEGWFEWEGDGRFAVRVEAVDAPRRLAWRWSRDAGTTIDAGPSTLVEWELEPQAGGGTLLILRESGFAADGDRAENAFGWFDELADLRIHLARHPWEKGIRRRLELRASPSRVWAALTDSSELREWWGSVAGLEFEPGSQGWFDFTEYGRRAVRIEAVETPRYLAWRWAPAERDTALSDAKQVCLVEWFVMPREDLGTNLYLLETEFDGPAGYDENSTGWDVEVLPVLRRHLGEPA
jgi:uncharacterized protein YndB with AHSA1/START domain